MQNIREILWTWRKWFKIQRARLGPWLLFQRNIRHYRIVSEEELCNTKRSDTLFIFGSGYSINDLTEDECRYFEQHDTLGFNQFFHQRIIRTDYHLIRELAENDFDPKSWKPEVKTYFNIIANNPYYRNTIFLVQTGFRAMNGNRAIGLRLLPIDNVIYLWRSLVKRPEYSPSLKLGLAHRYSTLEECVNFAFLLGWKAIVLVGVDLYDRRYFWLGPNETTGLETRRDASFDQNHSTAGGGMIDNLGRWARDFERQGVKVFVYNPKSLLAKTLPVYQRPIVK